MREFRGPAAACCIARTPTISNAYNPDTPLLSPNATVPSQNAIRLNAFEISDIQEEKLTPEQQDDQDVTMLHCAEKPLDNVFAEHGVVSRYRGQPHSIVQKRNPGSVGIS
jgi:hypothetical protein